MVFERTILPISTSTTHKDVDVGAIVTADFVETANLSLAYF